MRLADPGVRTQVARRLFEQMLDLEAVDSDDDVSVDESIEPENSSDRAFVAGDASDDIESVSSPDQLDELERRAELLRRAQTELSSLDPSCISIPSSPAASE